MNYIREQRYYCLYYFDIWRLAEAAGGVPMLKSLSAVLAHIRFCPTGGLTPENANSYLALPNVVCIGGSWMVSKKLVDGHQWGEIERLSRLAAALKGS